METKILTILLSSDTMSNFFPHSTFSFHYRMRLQTVTLILFASTTILQLSKCNLPPCSKFLCPSRTNNCVSLDIFNCTLNSILLPNITETPIYLRYIVLNERLVVNANNTRNALTGNLTTFDDLNPLWKELKHVNIAELTISNFCDVKSVSEKWKSTNGGKTCGASDKRFVTMNIDNFSVMKSTKFLSLQESCLENVVGNVSEKFPLLNRVEITDNYLSAIPSIFRDSSGLRYLSLDKNIIHNVTRRDFDNTKSLIFLSLRDNCIRSLPENVFHDLSQLEFLILNHNQLESLPQNLLDKTPKVVKFHAGNNKLEHIPEKFFEYSLNLKVIDLSYNKISNLPSELFRGLTKLTKIELNNNRLSTIDSRTFETNVNIRSLLLSDNDFKEMPTIKLHSKALASLDLSINKITVIKGPIISYLSRIASLILTGNCLKFIPDNDVRLPVDESVKDSTLTCENCCLEKINLQLVFGFGRHLRLAKNNITELTKTDLKYLSAFEKVDLRDNKIARVEIPFDYPLITKKPRIVRTKTINLAGNLFSCGCYVQNFLHYLENVMYNGNIEQNEVKSLVVFDVNTVVCYSPINLVNRSILSLTNMDFVAQTVPPDGCNPNCTYRTNCYANVTYVNCSNANLYEFPKKYPNKTEKLIIDFKNNYITSLPSKNDSIWHRVISLNLKNNQISSLVNLTSTSNLTNINFQDNKLTKLEAELISAFEVNNFNRTILLSGNPWICDCDLRTQLKMIFNVKNIHLPDQGYLKCSWNGREYKFTDFDSFCTIETSNLLLISSLSSLTVVVVVVSIVGFAFSKYKIQIKYLLFTRNLCLWWVSEEDLDADKEYDAFVSYSSLDSGWVYHTLVTGLENEHPRYKLCLHERDWQGGALIADQIVQSVEKSRRTIVVLTENFLNSEWSKVEFTVAYQRAIEDKVKRVVVVVPNDVPNLENCDSEFRSFITLTTYIEFNKNYFWRKLRCLMPRRRNLLEAEANDRQNQHQV